MPESVTKYVDYNGLAYFKSKLDDKFEDLYDYIDEAVDIEASGSIQGYYHNGVFYSDSEYHNAIEAKENFIYIDKGDSNKLYIYNGSAYEVVSDSGSADVSIDKTTTVDCGGITKGTNLTGKSLQWILETMFAPYVAPTDVFITAYTLKPDYVERNDTNAIESFRIRWTPGSVPVQKVVIGGDASMEVVPSSGNSFVVADIDDINFTNETKEFTATLVIPDHDNVVASCSISNNYVYPIYYGIFDNPADKEEDGQLILTQEDVKGTTKLISSGAQTLSYTMTDAYPMIASTRRLTKVTDISEVTDYTNSFMSSETEINISSVNPYWGPVKYYVYTGSKATLNDFTFKFTF